MLLSISIEDKPPKSWLSFKRKMTLNVIWRLHGAASFVRTSLVRIVT